MNKIMNGFTCASHVVQVEVLLEPIEPPRAGMKDLRGRSYRFLLCQVFIHVPHLSDGYGVHIVFPPVSLLSYPPVMRKFSKYNTKKIIDTII